MNAMRIFGMPRRDTVAQVGFVCFALGFGFALKRFYSQASCDDLRWVLAPTVWLVERITGAGFIAEATHGYLSRDLRYEIVPPCAGVNFMVVAFCSLACGLMHTRRTLPAQILWLLVSGLIAYGTTLVANGTRIAITVRLHHDGTSWGWMTPDRLHVATGVAVYVPFLCVIFALGARMTGARRDFAI